MTLRGKFSNLIRWCRLVFTSVSVEPVVFLHQLASSVTTVAFANLLKDRICLHYFEYTTEQCDKYGTGANKTIDLHVQKEWVVFDMYATLVQTIPAVFISLFLGSWSDLFGRRIPLISTFLGLTLNMAASLVLFSYPSLPLWMLFIPNFLSGISGGVSTLFTSVYAYIADISETGHARTLRITTADVSISLAITAGSYVSSLVLTSKVVSHSLNFWLGLVFAFLGLIYVVIFIKTTRLGPHTTTYGTGMLTRPPLPTVWHKIRAFGRIQFVLEAFRCAFKRRARHTRAVLWLLISILTLSVLAFTFETNIMLPFLTGAPLHWTTAYYARFRAYFGVPSVVVLGIGTYLLKRPPIRIDDVGLMLIGTISRIANAYVVSIAHHTYVMYIAQVLGLAGMMALIGSRAVVSGLVPRDEQGKVFSCTSVVESIIPIVAAIAANKVFAASVEWWPGLFAAITACIGCVSLVLLVIADRLMLQDKVESRREEIAERKVEAMMENAVEEFKEIALTDQV